MDFGTLIDPIKRHPFILLGGVAAVLIFVQLRGSKTAKTSTSASGVYSMTADPNQIALQAAHDNNAAQISMASIAAQTQQNYINSQTQLGLAALSTQAHSADIAGNISMAQVAAGAQLGTAQIGASMFDTAIQGITANYISQLKANGASNIAYSSYSNASGNGTNAGSGAPSSAPGGFAGNGNGGWNVNLNSGGNFGTTTVNPAGSAVINTANNQIEQLFNNVLRAGQGTSPLETQMITDGGGSTVQPATTVNPTPSFHDPNFQHGSDHGADPIFVNWVNGQHLPTVTDITPTVGSINGWIGSFINPNAGTTQTVH